MSDTSPKRKRFQFHLSAALAMMFVAGGIMWANARPVNDFVYEYQSSQSVMIDESMDGNVCYHLRRIGWPFEYWELDNNVRASKGVWIDCNPLWDKSDWFLAGYGKESLFYDAIIWILMVGTTGILIELLIRGERANGTYGSVHRQTVLLLVLTASVIILLNSQHRSTTIPVDFRYKDGYEIGWPMTVAAYLRTTWDYKFYTLRDGPGRLALASDFAVGVLALFIVAIFSEFVIRRRKISRVELNHRR